MDEWNKCQWSDCCRSPATDIHKDDVYVTVRGELNCGNRPTVTLKFKT